MTARRRNDFDLAQALDDPGFTPRRADVSALVAWVVAGGERGSAAARALMRSPEPAADVATGALVTADADARRRLTALLGRLASDHDLAALTSVLVARLGDDAEA